MTKKIPAALSAMSAIQAAEWLKISGPRFDALVRNGDLPRPVIQPDGRKMWTADDIRRSPFVTKPTDFISGVEDPKIYGLLRIYFIELLDFIKIGYTENVSMRLAQMQTAVPIDLKLLLDIPGDKTLEEIIHFKFAPIRVRGEWFKRHPALLAYIDALKSGTGEVLPDDPFKGHPL